MSGELEPLGGHAWRLTVDLPVAELERRIEARLAELGRSLRIPGFRPGKAPALVVRRRAFDRVCREEAERLAQQEVRAALAARGVRPVAAPKLRLEDLPAAQSAPGVVPPRVVASFEVFPPLPSIDLATLDVEVPKVSIGEADVERMLSRLPEDGGRARADGNEDELRRQLGATMERELVEALAAERCFLVEQALLARYPNLEIPASLLAAEPEATAAEARRLLSSTVLFAEIARQRGITPDPTRLWERTRELAAESADPAAELDSIWGDGERVQEIEEELLRGEVVTAVLAEARVHEVEMSFSELADRRRERLAQSTTPSANHSPVPRSR